MQYSVSPPWGSTEITEKDYLKAINNTRLIENNAARVNSLYYRYSQYLGIIPTPEEAEAEYNRPVKDDL